ncbi:hypothetical protein NDI37_09270 [Funiculus sociatus GB2-A5]|uniref:Uncharacterized protein n=1 Tax=Funiculus sociatus GB2-A5 TaxID=2933946 RepID=A0ABV0JMJ3_9CYAN|nr:hypothetical protein [Trichocoleus sp. FACHB-6]MBD1905806.1 hypothetical protein [Trichocoleus sp. FACHB-832]MBD2065365.1 hypothetical protein [Trichocoleus sp. FACHB-6]
MQQHHHKTPEDYGWRLKRRLRSRLSEELEDVRRDRDRVIFSYWWNLSE